MNSNPLLKQKVRKGCSHRSSHCCIVEFREQASGCHFKSQIVSRGVATLLKDNEGLMDIYIYI